MQRFRGGTAVVTGAASGIGFALAKRFADEGMNLVVCDIEPGPLAAATEELENRDVEVLSSVTDVADPAAVEDLAVRCEERFGPATVLCNNAGIAVGGLAWDVSPEAWDWILGVNLKGVVNGIRSFVSRMVAAAVEGHVVNTASIAGLTTAPLMSPYNVTKHGVVSISECLVGEFQMVGANIGVSVLCPGWVATRIHESTRNQPDDLPQSPMQGHVSDIVEQVIGQAVATGMDPDDVADAVVEAIRTDHFYIRTHEGMEQFVERRCQAIIEGRAPSLIGPLDITSD